MSQTDQVNEVNIGEELRKAEVEPLLPVEKKARMAAQRRKIGMP